MTLLTADWPAPDNIRMAATTRHGGVSLPPWDSANFGLRCGDNPADVQSNRECLQHGVGLACQPQWLHQVHGSEVTVATGGGAEAEADAVISRTTGLAAAVLTADCLPVLFCDRAGTVVAAAHAGWRGLAGGVLRNTVAAMDVAAHQLLAWLGPAISQAHFEVGPQVQASFIEQAVDDSHRRQISRCFIAGKADRQQADLYALARAELEALGVTAVFGGGYCTYRQQDLFYSYRRDGVTGRMASLVWME